MLIETRTLRVMKLRPNQERRRANLRILVKEAKPDGSAADLARLTGIAEQQLSHWETGFRNMNNRSASRLETSRGKPAGWMDQDNDPQAPAGDLVSRKVPLIAWDEARRHGEAMDFNANKKDSASFVVHDDELLDQGAFALRVRGDSMVSSDGKPSFPEGCIIIVEPIGPAGPRPGQHVIVQLSTAKEAVFKKLVEFDGQLWLKPLNSQYPIAPLPADAHILGVVVSVQNHEAIPRL